jgi:hypothetical protein
MNSWIPALAVVSRVRAYQRRCQAEPAICANSFHSLQERQFIMRMIVERLTVDIAAP